MSHRGQFSIIPKPAKISINAGEFKITPETVIHADKSLKEIACVFKEQTAAAMGENMEIVGTAPTANFISLVIDQNLAPLTIEYYKLKVTTESIEIRASGRAGIFYGLQTIRQMLPVAIFSNKPAGNVQWEIPCVVIEDSPRFKWRGLHLDVSRYFFDKEVIKRYIDLLSMHKFNKFHFHLTDDQGWRIEIKKYPLLTKVGGFRKETLIGHIDAGTHKYDGIAHGGFYTQDDIREIVEFARKRCVTVIPEIEMPGHAQAAIAAYPHLGNNSSPPQVACEWGIKQTVFNLEDGTIEFMKDVLQEVMELFPGQYIHIGGDECPKTQWQNSSRAQAKKKQLKLDSEDELQSWFIQQIDAFLTASGRSMVGWDEILEGGIAHGATIMSWRGNDGAIIAARAGHDVIVTDNRYTYFDFYQDDKKNEPLAIGDLLPIEKVYEYEPIPSELTEEQAKHVLGAQGQLWTEYIPTPAHLEYMAYPRACALIEVLWSKQKDEFVDFAGRLEQHLKRLDLLGINYRKKTKKFS